MGEVYVNGKFEGTVKDAQEFVDKVISERRKGKLNANINVQLNNQAGSVYIETGKGRARRPLLVVKDGLALLTEKHLEQLEKGEISWTDLINQGIIEYIDAAEEENALTAFYSEDLTPEHTHLEISPLSMVGLCTSLVPFGNFNQSTRLNAGSKNQKQALGFYAANYSIRLDMDVNILHTPQRPIVMTDTYNIAKIDKHPGGQNMIVAVMSYEGYNMEDSIILNQASIDRGLGRSSYYRPAIAEELRYSGGLIDEISIPDKEIKGYKSERDYRFLEEDGIIFPEAKVSENDVIIGKVSPPRFLSSIDEYNLATTTKRESSVAMKHGQQGIIDFVLLTENEEGNKLVQVKIRDEKVPEIGDKFTSKHGQKGVVGLIVPAPDMPFSASGIVPDLLFSPHGLPSRMTVSHLIELVAGKTGALAGRYINGTTFSSEPEADLRQELVSLGFKQSGTETFYNGISGEKFKAEIFVGSMHYFKLKHMVANKIHSRARGPIQLLTRQPTEGRTKEGGLRLGEMEKDTFVAHGASLLLKERFDSDKTILPIGEKSGLLAIKDIAKDKYHGIEENEDVSMVEMSYAFKLFLDELRALCIYPKLNLKNKY